MNIQLKNILKSLSTIGLEVNFAFDSGLSVAGLNLGRSKHRLAPRSAVALARCLTTGMAKGGRSVTGILKGILAEGRKKK
jgi:hypothetical protein